MLLRPSIRSVGCVVIELLEGKPPYHFLDPMPALFRIVQDDSPPIPEGASPVSYSFLTLTGLTSVQIVKDFLCHCFQKDCNLRISAKKLLKHPWMSSVRKQLQTDGIPGDRSLSNFDEALQKVQEWNEALKCLYSTIVLILTLTTPTAPSRPLKHKDQHPQSEQRDRRIVSPTLPSSKSGTGNNNVLLSLAHSLPIPLSTQLVPSDKVANGTLIQQPEEDNDNWDDDFEGNIPLGKFRSEFSIFPESSGMMTSQAVDKAVDADRCEMDDNAQTIRPTRSPGAKSVDIPTEGLSPIVEDYSDLAADDEDNDLQAKVKEFKVGPFVARTL